MFVIFDPDQIFPVLFIIVMHQYGPFWYTIKYVLLFDFFGIILTMHPPFLKIIPAILPQSWVNSETIPQNSNKNAIEILLGQ